MGKGWPFRKTKHDREASSSRANKKNEWDRHYVPVDHARGLFDEDRAVLWPDVNLAPQLAAGTGFVSTVRLKQMFLC
jgi:hypothetical protein